jgi:hypothetical protein
MSTESLEFKSSLDSSAFARGLRGMEEGANKAGSKIASSFENMAKGGVASLAAAFSIGAIVSFGKSVMDFAGDLQDTSESIGITTDSLQGLNAVFLAGGSDAETTKKGLITLTRSLQDIATTADGPARKALDALGISFNDIAGLTADEAMYVIADAMKGATDKGAALDAAMTLLGKSASKMAPALFGGAAAMREIAATNPKISDEDIKLIANMGDAWDALGTSIKVAAANAFSYFSKIRTETANSQGGEAGSMASIGGGFGGGFGALTNVDFSKAGQPVNEGAAAFEAESLAIGAKTKTVKAPIDPRIKAEQEAKMTAIEKEAAAMEKAVAARDKAESDSAAKQLTVSEQLQEAQTKTRDLQDYIASSEGIDQVNAQTELIKLEETKLDLVEKVAKAKADEAKKAQDLFQQNLDRENAAKADAFKDEMDKQKAVQQGKQKNAEEDMKLADDNLAKAKQNLEDVFTGKVKKPTKAETKLAAQMSTAMGEDVVQANKFGAEGGLGKKQLDATGKVITGLGSSGGLGGPARKDMPKGSAEAIARFNLAKQRQEAAKGNLTKTNEILDLINKGINGAK